MNRSLSKSSIFKLFGKTVPDTVSARQGTKPSGSGDEGRPNALPSSSVLLVGGVVSVKPLMTDEKGNFKFGSVRHVTLWGVDSMHSGDRDPPIFWAFFALIRSVSKRSSF